MRNIYSEQSKNNKQTKNESIYKVINQYFFTSSLIDSCITFSLMMPTCLSIQRSVDVLFIYSSLNISLFEVFTVRASCKEDFSRIP